MDYLHLVCYLVRLEEEKRGEAGKRKELQGTDGGKRKSEPIAINIQLLRYGTLQITYQQQKSPYYEQHRHNRETLQFQDVPFPGQDWGDRPAFELKKNQVWRTSSGLYFCCLRPP